MSRTTKRHCCFTLWGQKWTVWPWAKIVSQKMAKNCFLRIRFRRIWLQRSLGPIPIKHRLLIKLRCDALKGGCQMLQMTVNFGVQWLRTQSHMSMSLSNVAHLSNIWLNNWSNILRNYFVIIILVKVQFYIWTECKQNLFDFCTLVYLTSQADSSSPILQSVKENCPLLVDP